MSTNQQKSYQSYLLRLWRSGPHSPWRGSLQNTANGEKQSFADLPALEAFLVGQLAEEDAALVLADLATQTENNRNRTPHGEPK